MANLKITELVALTTPASGDVLPVVDVSDTSPSASGETKKITVSNPDEQDSYESGNQHGRLRYGCP